MASELQEIWDKNAHHFSAVSKHADQINEWLSQTRVLLGHLQTGALVLQIAIAFVVIVVGMLALHFFAASPIALDRKRKIKLVLIEKEEVTHNVRRFRFALPTPKHVLGLPVGRHISLSYTDDEGKLVSRTYTPVTSNDEMGYVDFVLKVYFPCERFPNGGKMSQHLNNLAIGDSMDAMGPKGNMTYMGKGAFELRHGRENIEIRRALSVGMIAGGTGVTPMVQLVREALKDHDDKTTFSLLFANHSVDDILLKKELDELAAKSDRFKVWYTITGKAPPKWKFSEGYINTEMMQNHLPPRAAGNMILVCGPPSMIKFACLPAFEELGLTEEMVYIEGNRSTMAIFQEHRRLSRQ